MALQQGKDESLRSFMTPSNEELIKVVDLVVLSAEQRGITIKTPLDLIKNCAQPTPSRGKREPSKVKKGRTKERGSHKRQNYDE